MKNNLWENKNPFKERESSKPTPEELALFPPFRACEGIYPSKGREN